MSIPAKDLPAFLGQNGACESVACPPRARRDFSRGFRGQRLERIVENNNGNGVELDNVKQAARWSKGKGEAKASLRAIKGPCDFVGCFTASGRCLYFDCKESADLIRLDTGK